MRAAVGRGNHHEPAEAPGQILGQRNSPNDAAHALCDQVYSLIAILIEPPQHGGQFSPMLFNG